MAFFLKFSMKRFREVIEIIKYPNNLNMDMGFEVCENWIPLINQQRNDGNHSRNGPQIN
jgi:hypothetical protein